VVTNLSQSIKNNNHHVVLVFNWFFASTKFVFTIPFPAKGSYKSITHQVHRTFSWMLTDHGHAILTRRSRRVNKLFIVAHCYCMWLNTFYWKENQKRRFALCAEKYKEKQLHMHKVQCTYCNVHVLLHTIPPQKNKIIQHLSKQNVFIAKRVCWHWLYRVTQKKRSSPKLE